MLFRLSDIRNGVATSYLKCFFDAATRVRENRFSLLFNDQSQLAWYSNHPGRHYSE